MAVSRGRLLNVWYQANKRFWLVRLFSPYKYVVRRFKSYEMSNEHYLWAEVFLDASVKPLKFKDFDDAERWVKGRNLMLSRSAKTPEDVAGIHHLPSRELLDDINECLNLVAAGKTEGLSGRLVCIKVGIEELYEWGQDWKNEALRQIRLNDPEIFEWIMMLREKHGDTNWFPKEQSNG